MIVSAKNKPGRPPSRHATRSARSQAARAARAVHDRERSTEIGMGAILDPSLGGSPSQSLPPVVGPMSPLAARLELLGNTLRPTPHVPLSMKGMNLFAKL